MTESLWPRRLNENHAELLQEVCGLFAAALLFFNHFLLQFFLVPSIMRSY